VRKVGLFLIRGERRGVTTLAKKIGGTVQGPRGGRKSASLSDVVVVENVVRQGFEPDLVKSGIC
jgi:hypothetical protein